MTLGEGERDPAVTPAVLACWAARKKADREAQDEGPIARTLPSHTRSDNPFPGVCDGSLMCSPSIDQLALVPNHVRRQLPRQRLDERLTWRVHGLIISPLGLGDYHRTQPPASIDPACVSTSEDPTPGALCALSGGRFLRDAMHWMADAKPVGGPLRCGGSPPPPQRIRSARGGSGEVRSRSQDAFRG
jgi:hypothetical protein